MAEVGPTKRKRLAATAGLLCTLVVALVVAVGPAAAESGGGSSGLPPYNGIQSFPKIEGPTGPEEFSWQVELGEGQTLRQISETEAWVEYEDGTRAFSISAAAARDAAGKEVPTSLRASEDGVLTLIVHHRAGDQLAGGAPFTYPVTSAAESEAPPHPPIIVQGPPDEAEIAAAEEARKEAERLAARRAAEAAATPPPSPALSSPPPARTCVVPSLRGLRLAAAKARLRGRQCAVGRVHFRAGADRRSAKVVKQSPASGKAVPAGTPVAVVLGSR